MSRRILSHIIIRLGHTVVTAENGMPPLYRLADAAPDLLILDLAPMPEMDRLTALRLERADERFRSLPNVMLNGCGLDRDARAARAEGVNEFMTKPFRSQELIDILRRLLE